MKKEIPFFAYSTFWEHFDTFTNYSAHSIKQEAQLQDLPTADHQQPQQIAAKFINFPEVEKLNQLTTDLKKNPYKKFTPSTPLLSLLFGYFLSPSFSFIRAAKTTETLTHKYFFLKPLARLLFKLAKTIRKQSAMEIIPIGLFLMFFRILVGLNLEWLIFAYYSVEFVTTTFNHPEDGVVLSSFFTLALTAFISFDSVWTVLASDFMAFLFIGVELCRYHKGYTSVLYSCFSMGALIAAFDYYVYDEYAWSTALQRPLSAVNSAALAMVGSLYFYRTLIQYHVELGYLFGYSKPSPLELSVRDITDTTCRVYWKFRETSRSFPFSSLEPKRKVQVYKVELNGYVIGDCMDNNVLLRDLNPGCSFKARIFAISNGHWVPSHPIYIRTLTDPPKSKLIDSGKVTSENSYKLGISSISSSKIDLWDEKEILHLQSELNNLKEQRVELESQIEELHESQSKEIEDIQAEIERVRASFSGVQQQAEKLRQKSELKALEDSKREVEATRATVQKELDLAKAEYNQVSEEMEQKKEDIEFFQTETARLKQEYTDGEKTYAAKQNQLKEDLQRLQGITAELSTAIDRRESDLDSIKSSSEDKQAQLAQLKKDRELAEKVLQVSSKHRSLKATDLKNLDEHYQTVLDDVTTLQRQVRQVAQNKHRIQTDLETLEHVQIPRINQIKQSVFVDPSDESIDDLLDAVNIDRLNSEADQDDAEFLFSDATSKLLMNRNNQSTMFDGMSSSHFKVSSSHRQQTQQSSVFPREKAFTSTTSYISPYINTQKAHNSFFTSMPFDDVGHDRFSIQTVSVVTSDLRPDAPEYRPTADEN